MHVNKNVDTFVEDVREVHVSHNGVRADETGVDEWLSERQERGETKSLFCF